MFPLLIKEGKRRDPTVGCFLSHYGCSVCVFLLTKGYSFAAFCRICIMGKIVAGYPVKNIPLEPRERKQHTE